MKTTIIAAAAAAIALTFAGVRAIRPFQNIAAAETLPTSAPAKQLVTPAVSIGCADAVLCVGDCKRGDAACVAECERDVSKPGERLYQTLMQCAEENHCDGDALCARKHCAAQVNACIGASAEGGCN